MVKKVALSGYYGFQNIGDEAILYSIIQALKLQTDCDITVFSNNPEQTSKTYGVKALDRWNFMKLFNGLKNNEILISGGGSLLQDVTGLRSLLYYLGVIYFAKLLRKKVFFYAQGIGPINTSIGQHIMKWVGNKVDLISVRDESSKKILEKMGVTKPEIRLTVDPVIGINKEQIDIEPGMKVLKEAGISTNEVPVIGVSVREWHNPDNYKKVIALVCDKLIEEGYKVMFIPFHFPGDIAPSRETIKFMKYADKAILLKNQVNVEEMFGILSCLHLLIGMRLHSLIMAAVMGVPIVGISYDPKVDAFMKGTYQPLAGRAETITEGELWTTVKETLDTRKENYPEFLQIFEESRNKALETAKWINEL
jgi:polysaccharide pyruvyl transferase CsaB